MEKREIAQAALESARMYWKFLSHEDLGFSDVDVNSFHRTIIGSTVCYVLHLQRDIVSPDGSFVRLLGQKYTHDQIKIAAYDAEKLSLTIVPSKKLLSIFDNLPTNSRDIKVVCDMKFLVQRVGEWFKSDYNIERLSMPTSALDIPPVNFSDFIGIPTEEQRDAINAIFQNPLTYIWGAPGTGKTKFVLAYAIMHCIRNGKKIIVSAPTNNAVDQTLLGVLRVLEQHDIPTNNVFRLGVPGHELISQYPQVCEFHDVSKKISECNDRIEQVKALIPLVKRNEEITHLQNRILPRAAEIEEIFVQNAALLEKQRILQESLPPIESDVVRLKSSLIAAKTALDHQQQNMSTFLTRLLFFFRPKIKQSEYDNLEQRVQKYNELLALSSAAQKRRNDLLAKIDAAYLEAENVPTYEMLKSRTLALYEEAEIPLDAKDITVLDNITHHLKSCLDEKRSILPGSEYDCYSVSQLEQELIKLTDEQKEYLNVSSRLDNAPVIAATTDLLFSRYSLFREKTVHHFFMDEAAYSPLIKGLISFSFGCSVTFLGDHCQIPPVCEMSVDRILKDPQISKSQIPLSSLWMQSAIHCESLFSASVDEIYKNYTERSNISLKQTVQVSLNVTHRFNGKLADILASDVYTESFKGVASDGDSTKIVVINAPFRPNSTNKKRENTAEVDAIKHYLATHALSDFAILTPYKHQVKLLCKEIPNEHHHIMTVHAAQGKEWDTVFFSVTDTTSMWFTDSTSPKTDGKRIINTAVSRAKKTLIIVCDCTVWMSRRQQLISHLIENASEIH